MSRPLKRPRPDQGCSDAGASGSDEERMALSVEAAWARQTHESRQELCREFVMQLLVERKNQRFRDFIRLSLRDQEADTSKGDEHKADDGALPEDAVIITATTAKPHRHAARTGALPYTQVPDASCIESGSTSDKPVVLDNSVVPDEGGVERAAST